MLDELGGFDEGFRLYGEDIDLQYRAAAAGWERWYVPAAVVRHEHKAETDRAGSRGARSGTGGASPASSASTLRDCVRPMSVLDKFDRIADGYSEHDYADPVRYAARRAKLIVELGARLEPGESVLDLGCGDGIMAAPLTAYGLRYRGVDASAGMVAAARARNPGVPFEVGRSEEYAPPEPVDATVCLRSFYYPADRVAFFRHVAGYTRRKFVFDFRPRVHDAASVVADLEAAGFRRIELRAVLPAAAPPAARARSSRSCTRPSGRGRSRGSPRAATDGSSAPRTWAA